MDQENNTIKAKYCYFSPGIEPWIRVDGFRSFETKGLPFPVDILVKSYNQKTDMFMFHQYFYFKLEKPYQGDTYWSYPFYSKEMFETIRYRTRLIGYRPTLCVDYISSSESFNTIQFEKMFFGE